MFLLSESELGSILLKTVSRIDIILYKSRNESLNIFNLEWDFDENIIPLITTTLECRPVLIQRKTYIGLDFDYIIECPNACNSDIDINIGVYSDDKNRFPSFHIDIESFNNNNNNNNIMKSKQKHYWKSKQLHASMIYNKSQELVRIYTNNTNNTNNNNGEKCNIFNPQDTFGCKEEYIICWYTVWGVFELCILPNRKCIWRLVVDVIEDNHFIDSKVDTVNTWLEKIHKLKSTIKIANQETNQDTNLKTNLYL
jgi:hypothetical protein